MEAFSLLKYWRGGGHGAASAGAAVVSTTASSACATTSRRTSNTTTIATSVLRSGNDGDDESADGDDEGPFFDLEFAVPDEDEGDSSRGGDEEEHEEEVDGEEREFNFAVSSDSSCGGLQADPSLSLSPSDDLFFKGRLVPLEPSSLIFHPSESNCKHQFLPGSLRKSATKFRVFTLGLKKPKSSLGIETTSASAAPAPAAAPSPKHQQQQQGSKFFTVKFKVEEVPIKSLFTRDNSSRSSSSSNGRAPKQQGEDSTAAVEDKKASKDLVNKKEIVNKYLNKIKPLYVRVSKRYGEKLRFSGQLSSTGPAFANGSSPKKAEVEGGTETTETAPATTKNDAVKNQKPTHVANNLPSGLRVVCKHLGKSRSASSAVAAVPSPPPALSRRRDDSLLQQQDGIQSAIAHCKRSFNATREVETPLPRSRSDSYDERCGVEIPKCSREDCV